MFRKKKVANDIDKGEEVRVRRSDIWRELGVEPLLL